MTHPTHFPETPEDASVLEAGLRRLHLPSILRCYPGGRSGESPEVDQAADVREGQFRTPAGEGFATWVRVDCSTKRPSPRKTRKRGQGRTTSIIRSDTAGESPKGQIGTAISRANADWRVFAKGTPV